MTNVVLVGAGKLGSRHLQAISQARLKNLKIFVVDFNPEAITNSKKRLEEVGIKKNYEILMEREEWLSYSLPSSLKKIVWDGRYVGQIQKWFACKFFGKDQEFDLETHKPEFEEWKWIRPEDAVKLVVPFKKKLYEDVLKSFENLY